MSIKSLQRIIGPVTRHAYAWPAPDPLPAEANVMQITLLT